jgi:hypothetical protein
MSVLAVSLSPASFFTGLPGNSGAIFKLAMSAAFYNKLTQGLKWIEIEHKSFPSAGA